MEGLGEVFRRQDRINESFGHDLTLIQEHRMRKPVRYFLHVVGDHDNRRGIRIEC